MKGKLFLLIVTATLIMILSMTAKAQYVAAPIDIKNLIESGHVTATTNPAFPDPQIVKILFDRDNNSSVHYDPYTVTLSFDKEYEFLSSSFYAPVGKGNWTVEIANTLDDLNNQTPGAYFIASSQKPYSENTLSDTKFSNLIKGKIVRLTATRSDGYDLYIGEWSLSKGISEAGMSINIQPSIPIMLNVGSSYPVRATGWNQDNISIPLNNVSWVVGNSSIASVNGGNVFGLSEGKTTITAKYGNITASKEITVANDFELPKATTLKGKVLVIIEDPIVPSQGKHLTELFDYNNSDTMAVQLRDAIYKNSGGVVDYSLEFLHIDDKLYSKRDGNVLSADTVYKYNGDCIAIQGGHYVDEVLILDHEISFDMEALENDYNLCARRSKGEFTEIWIFSWPCARYGESQTIAKNGNEAPWINGPTYLNNKCTSNIPIMGFNYADAVDQAYHSYGHRVESIMRHVFGRWDNKQSNLNNWESFTLLESEKSGMGNIGSIHSPVNATIGSEYDDANDTLVTSYCDNWKQYPFLGNKTRQVNREEWGKLGELIIDGQLVKNIYSWGYLQWWHSHLPKYIGVDKDGILNNWWHYVLDIQDARKEEIRINKDNSSCSNGINFSNVSNGFENTVFPGDNWVLYNPDGKKTWQRGDVTNSGGYGKSSHYAVFDNGYQSSNKGQIDAISTQSFDFTNVSNAVLKFDVAYKRFNQYYVDALAVYATADCGTSKTLLYKKEGNTLSTSPGDYVGIFYPKANEWRTETLDLSAFAGRSSVTLIFENISGYGQLLYLDNISVESTSASFNVGVQSSDINKLKEMDIFPNPNEGAFILLLSNEQKSNYELSVYNSLGQQIYTEEIKETRGEDVIRKELDLTSMQKGIYFLQAMDKTNGNKRVQRVIIK